MITCALATSQDWGKCHIGHLWNILGRWLKGSVPAHPQSTSWRCGPRIHINFKKLPGLLFCTLKFDNHAIVLLKPGLRAREERSVCETVLSHLILKEFSGRKAVTGGQEFSLYSQIWQERMSVLSLFFSIFLCFF